MKLFICNIFLFLIISCSAPDKKANLPPALHESQTFIDYWQNQPNEISIYRLKQSVNDKFIEGNAILIFGIENYSLLKQVKLDDPENAGADRINVLKMMLNKNLTNNTGPQSIMLSTVTPTDHREYMHALKVVMSDQGWDGQAYAQLNQRGKKFHLQLNSDQETFADSHSELNVSLLEDELWNRIRLHPDELPEGDVDIVPGLFFCVENNVHTWPIKATLKKEILENEIKYHLSFVEHRRNLIISFQKKFPHQITGWEENYISNGKPVQVITELIKTLRVDFSDVKDNDLQHLQDSINSSK